MKLLEHDHVQYPGKKAAFCIGVFILLHVVALNSLK